MGIGPEQMVDGVGWSCMGRLVRGLATILFICMSFGFFFRYYFNNFDAAGFCIFLPLASMAHNVNYVGRAPPMQPDRGLQF